MYLNVRAYYYLILKCICYLSIKDGLEIKVSDSILFGVELEQKNNVLGIIL